MWKNIIVRTLALTPPSEQAAGRGRHTRRHDPRSPSVACGRNIGIAEQGAPAVSPNSEHACGNRLDAVLRNLCMCWTDEPLVSRRVHLLSSRGARTQPAAWNSLVAESVAICKLPNGKYRLVFFREREKSTSAGHFQGETPTSPSSQFNLPVRLTRIRNHRRSGASINQHFGAVAKRSLCSPGSYSKLFK